MKVEPRFAHHGSQDRVACLGCRQSRPLAEWTALVRRGPIDPPDPEPVVECIDLEDPADIVRWCEELGVDEAKLREAVGLVGPMAKAVRYWLLDKTHIRPARFSNVGKRPGRVW